jgi:hypothetical protein
MASQNKSEGVWGTFTFILAAGLASIFTATNQ